MKRHLHTIVILALSAIALLAGCTAPDRTGGAQSDGRIVSPRGKIIFDMGHGEIFGAQDTTELGQSQAIARMNAAGLQVAVNNDLISAEDLADASGLILAGPMSPLTQSEFAVITSFAQRGGTVLLTIHVPFPVTGVPAYWGLPVGTEILMSKRPFASAAEPSVFLADKITAGPVTEGVRQVLVVSGWPVGVTSSTGSTVVETGEDAWLSAAGDQQPQAPADAKFGSYGVIGITSLGKGQVIVSGDDAIFANLALGQADNAKLLDNIIRLMSEMSEV